MYPNQPSVNRQRQLYLTLRKKLQEQGIGAEVIRPQTLRIFAPLENSVGKAEFSLSSKTNILKGAEVLLKDAEMFIGNVLAFGVAQVPIINNNVSASGMKIVSYPASIFSSTKGSGKNYTERDSIAGFFNGLASLKIDSNLLFENLAVSNFVLQPHTDTIVPLGLAPRDVQQTFIFNGGKDNTITVQMPDAKGDAIEGVEDTTQNFGCVEITGFSLNLGNSTNRDLIQSLFSND